MSEIIYPTYEVKLNSEFVDEIAFDSLNQDKIVLQQFKGEENLVYLCLNNRQVKIDINSLYRTVKFMFGEYTDSLK